MLFTELRCFSTTGVNPLVPCQQNLFLDQTEIGKASPVCSASLAASHQTSTLEEAEVLQEKEFVIS